MTRRAGFGLGLASAAAFGSSGTLATGLLGAGWTPGGAVAARVGTAAAALTAPALWQLHGRWGLLRRSMRSMITYGLLAVAGAQLCYFNAIAHLSVAVALLIEYSGVVLVVGWQWARRGQRPTRATAVGAAVAVLGLVLVLGLLHTQRFDLTGLLWGLGAAVGLATYFVLSAGADDALPPLVTAWSGLVIGAAGLLAAAAVGALPLRATTAAVRLSGHRLPWWVAVAGLALLAGALAYVTGVAGARRLGARLASFLGLAEVLFAATIAWLLLGQRLAPAQLVGGLLVVAGIVLVRAGEPAGRGRRGAEPPVPAADPAA